MPLCEDDPGNVTLPQSEHNQLVGLLSDPRETLDVEIKSWLGLTCNGDHKAKLAKALLALANHGGGFVIIGLEGTDTGYTTAPGRPVNLDAYSQEVVSGIVYNYAEPAFHCEVHHVRHPTSNVIHPIIVVPGGHRVPIRAKRNGPNDRIVQQYAVYIRRPGPQSALPITGREWDELFAKCLRERRDELLDHIRDLLSGRPSLEGNQTETSRLNRWMLDCRNIWQSIIDELPPGIPARCPHGFFTFAYNVDGGTPLVGFAELREVLREAPRLTGWNTWWVPTRQAIAPYVNDGAIECWIGGDTSERHREYRDADHSDFWRVTPDGRTFLLRGYQEDGNYAAQGGIQPGTCLDPTLPIWRIGEALLHATYFADRLDGNSVSFAARYTGLRERRLAKWANPMEGNWASGISRDDDVLLTTSVAVDTLSANLVEVVHSLLSPLYERFNFTRLPLEIVQRELNRLRKRG